MTLKKLLILGLLLIMPAIVFAEDTGRVYTIKKGDTLWGISERFLKDPYYWPNLWSNNPTIANPHLVYPGQKVMIYDGRIEIVGKRLPVESPARPAAEEPAGSVATATPAEPQPQEDIVIKTLGGAEGFVGTDLLQRAGRIIDTTDNRIMMAEGDTVFCEMLQLAEARPGDAFNLVEVGHPVRHPLSGEIIGHQVATLGSLVIVSADQNVATGKITSSFREIRRGALLLPFEQPAREVILKQSPELLHGYVIAAREGKISLGQNDILYVDLGKQDGLESGNLLYLTRSRQPSELVQEQTQLRLPDVLLGSAVVLESGQQTATALILKAVEAVFVGDKVQTVTQ